MISIRGINMAFTTKRKQVWHVLISRQASVSDLKLWRVSKVQKVYRKERKTTLWIQSLYLEYKSMQLYQTVHALQSMNFFLYLDLLYKFFKNDEIKIHFLEEKMTRC